MLCLLAKLDSDKVAVVGSAEEAGQAAAAGSCVSLVVREGVQVGGEGPGTGMGDTCRVGRPPKGAPAPAGGCCA